MWNGTAWQTSSLTQQVSSRSSGSARKKLLSYTATDNSSAADIQATATATINAPTAFAPYTLVVLFPPLDLPPVSSQPPQVQGGVSVLAVILAVIIPLVLMISCVAIALDVNSRRKPVEEVSSTATYDSENDKE